MRILLLCSAWLLAAFIAVSTLSPISFRPHLLAFSPDVERFVAFFGLAIAFMIAYPAHRILIALLLTACAILLEVAQNFVPGRHGVAADAAIKLLGTGLALFVMMMAQSAFQRRGSSRSE